MAEQETAATPAAPAAPAATTPETTPPAAPAATPAPSQEAKTVSLPETEVEQLRKDAARTQTAQKDAADWKTKYERATRGGGAGISGRHNPRFSGQAPAAPAAPSEEQVDETAFAEDRKAERGLVQIALDPKYREVLDADSTLRTLFGSTPLNILPILAPDAFDAEDALTQVREALDNRLAEMNKGKGETTTTAPTNPENTPESKPATPPAGGVNPPAADVNADEDYEAAQKETNTESAIAHMVGAKLRGAKTK